MGGPAIDQQLLTDEARRAYLHVLFGHRFTLRGKLQLPRLSTYNQLHTDKGLSELGTEICRWIGLKPNGLTFQFTDKHLPSGYYTDLKSKQILIDSSYKKHPYGCGAMAALAVTTYAITKLGKADPDRELIELATIELGISLWIINALAPKTALYLKIYHLIDSSWQEKESISLQAFNTSQYVESVVQNAHENRIPADEYLPHISKRGQSLIPTFTRKQSTRYLPEPHQSYQHRKAARVFWTKIILSTLIFTLAISLAIYVASIKTEKTNPRAQEQVRTIETLRNQFTECQAQASKQQSDYDPNDLFLTRQVDATKARCESLRNQYNYAIDQYQILD